MVNRPKRLEIDGAVIENSKGINDHGMVADCRPDLFGNAKQR